MDKTSSSSVHAADFISCMNTGTASFVHCILTRIGDVPVNFTVMSHQGCMCTFASDSSVIVLSNETGYASSPTCTGNGVPGSLFITATVPNFELTAAWTLYQLGPPALLTILSGNDQTAEGLTTFPIALSAKLTDSAGNPLSGKVLVITAPNATDGSPSATSNETDSETATAITDSNGIVSFYYNANRIPGTFTITISLSSMYNDSVTPVQFNETNLVSNPANVTILNTVPPVLLGENYDPIVVFVEDKFGPEGMKRQICNVFFSYNQILKEFG